MHPDSNAEMGDEDEPDNTIQHSVGKESGALTNGGILAHSLQIHGPGALLESTVLDTDNTDKDHDAKDEHGEQAPLVESVRVVQHRSDIAGRRWRNRSGHFLISSLVTYFTFTYVFSTKVSRFAS